MCPLRCASLLEPICTTARKFLRDGAARGNLRTRLCLDHASPHRPVGKSNKLSSMAHALAAVQWHIRIRLRQYRRFQGHQSLRWRVLATTPQKVSLVTDDAGWSSTRCLRARPPLRRRRLLCVPATHVALRAAERHCRCLRQRAGLSRCTRGPALLRGMLRAQSSTFRVHWSPTRDDHIRTHFAIVLTVFLPECRSASNYQTVLYLPPKTIAPRARHANSSTSIQWES